MERNDLSKFGRGSPKEHFCDLFRNQATGLGGDVV